MSDAPLTEVEQAVAGALLAQRDDGLRVLGYGEITLVIGWPTEDPRWACKRLPRFADQAAAQRYEELLHSYLGRLRTRGVEPVPTTFHTVESFDGGRAGYVVQPVLPPGSLGPEVLRAAEPDPDHPLIAQVCELVPAVVDDRTGLDGQISNWALVGKGAGATLQYLDVTTPMLFDASGTFELDLGIFLAAYPWLLRGTIRRFVAPGVAGAYRDPRHVLLDLAGTCSRSAWSPGCRP